MTDYLFSNKEKQENEQCIGDLLAKGKLILDRSGNSRAEQESALLLSYLLDKERSYLYLNRHLPIPKTKVKLYYQWIIKRSKDMPIQYITGFQNFMGLEFAVSEGVFIPRAETEILVEKVIQLIEMVPETKQLSLLDIGVGCGVIPITICYYFKKRGKGINFHAVDLSAEALALAAKNAQRFQCEKNIHFYCGNLFQPLRKIQHSLNFEGIISNPPYLSRRDWENLPVEIRHFEPAMAFLAGERGLDFYEKIIAQSPQYLKPGGFLALEIGHQQKDALYQIIHSNQNYQRKICVLPDYYQNDRVIIAFKNDQKTK